MESSAEEENAETIASELEQVWGKWYEIGFSLEIPTSKLDRLESAGGEVAEKMTVSVSIYVYVYTTFKSCVNFQFFTEYDRTVDSRWCC